MMIPNRLKTFLLLGLLTGMLASFGAYVGDQAGFISSLLLAGGLNFFLYFYSASFALRMFRARPLAASEYPQLHEIVRNLAQKMSIPMPEIWVMQLDKPNAFATGRNPKHASVAVTTGLAQLLDHDEIEGVLAHELSHVKNRDILIGTVATVMASAVGYLGNRARYMHASGQQPGSKQRNPFFTILFGSLLPLAALLVRLGVSRSREYAADESAAYITRKPLALAAALQKIHSYAKQHTLFNWAKAMVAPLFIVTPMVAPKFRSLFSTHPPVSERVRRLEEINKKMFKKNPNS